VRLYCRVGEGGEGSGQWERGKVAGGPKEVRGVKWQEGKGGKVMDKGSRGKRSAEFDKGQLPT
jgi:hypothetical protein